jgi:hypothetical protein
VRWRERWARTLAVCILFVSLVAAAEPRGGDDADAAAPADVPALLEPADGGYLHLMAALALGRGIRFNNPYRLATPLGDDPESLSLSATYLDLGAGITAGPPEGLQHGGSLHFSVAVEGVPQEVATPSYLVLHRFPPRLLAFARAGLPVVIEPDLNLGYELALGGAFLVSAGLGVTAEVVGDVFYGAATQEQALTVIPMLSFQVGVFFDYEVLP